VTDSQLLQKVTDSQLFQKFPAFTEPKTVMKSVAQNAQETSDEGLEMDIGCQEMKHRELGENLQ